MIAPGINAVHNAALDAAPLIAFARKLGPHFGIDPDAIEQVVTAASINARGLEAGRFHQRVTTAIGNDP
jgi:hypothetical protein